MLNGLLAMVVGGAGIYTTIIALVLKNPGDGVQGIGTVAIAIMLYRQSFVEKRLSNVENILLNSSAKGAHSK